MRKIKITFSILAVLLITIVSYFAGYSVGHRNLVFNEKFKPKVVNLDFGKPKDVDFSTFWSAWNAVTNKFAGTYSTKEMVYGAIRGMMESLEDPYSTFLKPDQNKSFSEDLAGKIQGIGAELTAKDNQIVVVAPLPNSPAQKAGIMPEDKILKINGESTDGMSVEQAVNKIRGKAGTEVKLLISREEWPAPQEMAIQRAVVKVESVKAEMKDQIGYIQISQFGDDTTVLIEKFTEELAAQNPKAIVLDLRGNPGGYLDTAINVSSLFMDKGVVVKEQKKNGEIVELQSTLNPRFNKIKIVVLIDEGSASASEIVAGALRDNRGAVLVGLKSFGKGSVQEIEELSDGSAVKITVAKWLTPKGQTIDKEGIKPDIEISISSEDRAANRDPQLDRALLEANK